MRQPKILIKKAGKNKGQCMVVIIAANGKVLLTSEILNRRDAAKRNIKSASKVLQRYAVGLIKLTEEF